MLEIMAAFLIGIAVLLTYGLIFVSLKTSRWLLFLNLAVIFAFAGFLTRPLIEVLFPLYFQSFAFRHIVHAFRDFHPYNHTDWRILCGGLALFIGVLCGWIITTLTGKSFYDSQIRGASLLTPFQVNRKLRRRLKLPKGKIYIGQYFLLDTEETRSLLLFGAPGSGKTLVVIQVLYSIRRRGERFFVIDSGGELFARFFSKSDCLLSPFDGRSKAWSVFAEIRNIADCKTIASALIPEGYGESKAWHDHARELTYVVLCFLWKSGRRTNGDFVAVIWGPLENLKNALRDSTASLLFEPGSEKMLSNVRSIIGEHLSFFVSLDPGAGENAFSVRNWLVDSPSGLFFVYRDSDIDFLRPMMSALVEILVVYSLSLLPDSGRRIWGIMDELPALRKLSKLDDALSKGRKYGLSLVMGVQNISQLYHLYEENVTHTILGDVGNQVILRTPDPKTSDLLSRSIGDAEFWEKHVSSSSSGDTQTRMEKKQERLVIASEISNLPDRQGFVRIGGVGWTKAEIPITKLKRRVSLPESSPQITPAINVKDRQWETPENDYDEI